MDRGCAWQPAPRALRCSLSAANAASLEPLRHYKGNQNCHHGYSPTGFTAHHPKSPRCTLVQRPQSSRAALLPDAHPRRRPLQLARLHEARCVQSIGHWHHRRKLHRQNPTACEASSVSIGSRHQFPGLPSGELELPHQLKLQCPPRLSRFDLR